MRFFSKKLTSPQKFRGALVYLSADLTIPNNVATNVAWDVEEYDTSTIHDNSTNNSRLTVPIGVSYVRVKSHTAWLTDSTGQRYSLIRKNGINVTGGGQDRFDATSAAGNNYHSNSAVLKVTGGDYFELKIFQNSGGDLDIHGGTGDSWFSMEIVE